VLLELDGEDSRALAAVGAFRIVPEHDLDLPHDTLRLLTAGCGFDSPRRWSVDGSPPASGPAPLPSTMAFREIADTPTLAAESGPLVKVWHQDLL